jgi:hypothetical protein
MRNRMDQGIPNASRLNPGLRSTGTHARSRAGFSVISQYSCSPSCRYVARAVRDACRGGCCGTTTVARFCIVR